MNMAASNVVLCRDTWVPWVALHDVNTYIVYIITSSPIYS